MKFFKLSLPLMCLLAFARGAADEPVSEPGVYIITRFTPANAHVDTSTFKRMLLGDIKEWPDGRSVLVVLPGRESGSYIEVSAFLLGSRGANMSRYWLRKVFGGEARAPDFESSDTEIINKVLNNENAVGALVILPDFAIEGLQAVKI